MCLHPAGPISSPSAPASATTKLSPPKPVSTVSVPRPGTSSVASKRWAKDGRFVTATSITAPSRQVARTSTSPPGASSRSRVSGSSIGRMPVSRSTVATQIEFEPDIGGLSAGSMMRKPICARGSLGGTSRFTCRNTPPRGSFRTKLRRRSSAAMKSRCAQSVSPGGGATPPTITSPTSPAAWALTT